MFKHLLALTVVALALPAAAEASTASIEDGVVVWRGDATGETVYAYVPYSAQANVQITGVGVKPGPGCSEYYEPSNGERGALCPNLAAWRFEAGDGADKIVTLSNPREDSKADATQVDLGPGDDTFETSFSVATVHGGDGDDTLKSSVHTGTYNYDDVYYGDAGDDVLLGGYGADKVYGGPGNDELLGDGRSIERHEDLLDGGEGRDSLADYVPIAPYKGATASISFDGLANDGFPGEHDDIRNVEEVRSFAALDFLGSDGPDEAFFSYQNERLDPVGPSTLRGLGGDDVLTGTLRADTLDGGAGRDVLDGAEGDDSIAARDGEVDTVRCGAGADRAVVDDAEQVGADCETVERPTTPAPPGPPAQPVPPPPPGPPAPPAPPAPVPALGVPQILGKPTLKSALAAGFKVRVPGDPGGFAAVRALRGRQLLASGVATVGTAGVATVKVRFSAKARKALKGARTVKLTVVAGDRKLGLTLRR